MYRSRCVGGICAEQTDLLLEADNLDAFNANFAGKNWEDCVFPRVLHRVEDVLVGFLYRLVAFMLRHHDANTVFRCWEKTLTRRRFSFRALDFMGVPGACDGRRGFSTLEGVGKTINDSP